MPLGSPGRACEGRPSSRTPTWPSPPSQEEAARPHPRPPASDATSGSAAGTTHSCRPRAVPPPPPLSLCDYLPPVRRGLLRRRRGGVAVFEHFSLCSHRRRSARGRARPPAIVGAGGPRMCARTHRPQLPPTIVAVHSRPGPTLPHASRPRIQARGPHHAGRREPSACARVARSHARVEFVSWRVRLPIIQRNAHPPPPWPPPRMRGAEERLPKVGPGRARASESRTGRLLRRMLGRGRSGAPAPAYGAGHSPMSEPRGTVGQVPPWFFFSRLLSFYACTRGSIWERLVHTAGCAEPRARTPPNRVFSPPTARAHERCDFAVFLWRVRRWIDSGACAAASSTAHPHPHPARRRVAPVPFSLNAMRARALARRYLIDAVLGAWRAWKTGQARAYVYRTPPPVNSQASLVSPPVS